MMGGDEAMETYEICMGANLTCMNDLMNRMGEIEMIFFKTRFFFKSELTSLTCNKNNMNTEQDGRDLADYLSFGFFIPKSLYPSANYRSWAINWCLS